MDNKTFLIVAAHPDDEILGCGASAAKLINEGWNGHALILCKGKAARGIQALQERDALANETEKARKIIGLQNIVVCDFPDNMFDTVPLLHIVREVEKCKKEFRPQLIFTHYAGDLNIDHTVTFRAVLTATRPLLNDPVKEILLFEIPSSTEWSSFQRENIFVPNVFYDISSTLKQKLNAMNAYKSELREYPHPRSLKYLKEHASLLGAKVGLKNAEGFQLLRQLI